ncbi:hypothetical protein KKE06_04825 [Candidatus Micrarchaeota archaeon]|nr:hypothetical protein [Candidatus Micrarchaeota archaeon]MBU1931039.1 hypothetical protein [Candidatus Micrarchaeota archaeon]
MSAWQRFTKMPLGIKILFILAILGLISSIIRAPIIFDTSSIMDLMQQYTAISAVIGFVFSIAVLFGLWKAKKFTEKIYLLATVVSILELVIIMGFLPTLFTDFFEQSIGTDLDLDSDSELSGLSPEQREAFTEALIDTMIQVTYIGLVLSIILNFVFYWYVRNQKAYFVN